MKLLLHTIILYAHTAWLPYLTLQTTPGVVTYTVPPGDDVYSSPIQIPGGFPIGNDKLFSVFVSRKIMNA